MKPLVSRLLWGLRYSLGWLPFFLLYVLAMYASTQQALVLVSFQTAFYLGPGYVLGAGAWWYADWVSSGRHRWGRYFWLHLGGGLAYTAIWHGVFFGAIVLLRGQGGLVVFARTQTIWMILTGMMVYGLLVGMCSVSRLSRQVRERELNAAKAESLRIRAEMEALRGQLDPHFLFNTLHSITALVREDPVRAEEALLQFGELLRHVIAKKREGVDELPLREELAFIDRYLELEKLRLGERLRVERNYEPEALDCWIPAFTVQPLVENAIRHGIAPHRQGGTIRLAAEVVSGQLRLSVHDDGPGAAPGTWTQSQGVGLTAVRQRLELRHGTGAGLRVTSAPGEGFGVNLFLPAVQSAVVEAAS